MFSVLFFGEALTNGRKQHQIEDFYNHLCTSNQKLERYVTSRRKLECASILDTYQVIKTFQQNLS